MGPAAAAAALPATRGMLDHSAAMGHSQHMVLAGSPSPAPRHPAPPLNLRMRFENLLLGCRVQRRVPARSANPSWYNFSCCWSAGAPRGVVGAVSRGAAHQPLQAAGGVPCEEGGGRTARRGRARCGRQLAMGGFCHSCLYYSCLHGASPVLPARGHGPLFIASGATVHGRWAGRARTGALPNCKGGCMCWRRRWGYLHQK